MVLEDSLMKGPFTWSWSRSREILSRGGGPWRTSNEPFPHTTPEGMSRGGDQNLGQRVERHLTGAVPTGWTAVCSQERGSQRKTAWLLFPHALHPPCLSLPVSSSAERQHPLYPVMQNGELLIEEWPEGPDGQKETVQHTRKCTYECDDWSWISTIPDPRKCSVLS